MIIKYKRAAMCKGTLYDARAHICREAKKKKFALSLHSPFRFWEEKGIWVDHKPCCGNGLGFAFLPNESSGWTDGEMNG